MAERVGQVIGNYQLLRLLGRGAFAEVYLAEHRYLEVPAAIKVLHVHMESDNQEKFRREAHTIAHLQHPHIIRVHDFGFQDQTTYLVMEYTPNGTLRTRHPKGARLPLEQIVAYVKQIASALDYAHQQRVIHRDVKPENMLLTANDEVVLSDFGIAVVQHSLDSLSTQSQAGTPVYMAPEQIQREPCAASDQYAVGVLAYEWLCGEPPFRGSLFEVLSQHLHEPPPSLCARVPSLPAAVEDAVFGALAKDPHARFDSVQDFADVLEEVCDATQTLSLHVPTERSSQAQISPSETLHPPLQVLAAKEEEQSSFSTPSFVLTHQRTEDTEEPVEVQVLPPAVQTYISSGHEQVSVSRTNRQRLLRKVRAYWIAGVLEHSLHGAALLALGLQEQPDAVANPWQLVLQHPAGAPRPLSAGTRITRVYDAAEGELLILGAPGSGKTTLLLELARELLSRAEQDEQHPLPVVFNLSSWASKHQRLTDWLVEELNRTYQVPRKLGETWVEADQILPLLDGLDEVAPQDRTACIEAINTYRQEHGLLPLVVCSRSADYLAQSARVHLDSAVAVQPLTPQQVDDYLASGGEPLWALRLALHQDAALRELTHSPLMLSILTLTYHGVPVEELLREASITDRQQQIFERYIERMLRQRGAEVRYPQERTMHWLSWLARQLKQHNQTVFYIEQMQPDWLEEHRWRRAYEFLGVRLPGVLIGILTGIMVLGLLIHSFWFPSEIAFYGMVGGLIGGLLFQGKNPIRPSAERKSRSWGERWLRLIPLGPLRNGVLIGCGAWLILGWYNWGSAYAITYALSFGVSSFLLSVFFETGKTTQPQRETKARPWSSLWHSHIKTIHVRNGLIVGITFWLSRVLIDAFSTGFLALNFLVLWRYLWINRLETGFYFGLIGFLLSAILVGRSRTIQPTDKVLWSWSNLWHNLINIRHVRNGVLVGAIAGVISYVSIGPQAENWWPLALIGLGTCLLFGLTYWVLLALYQGVSSQTLDEQRRVKPNEGIRRSGQNAIRVGFISWLLIWLISFLTLWLIYWLIGWLSSEVLGPTGFVSFLGVVDGWLFLHLGLTGLTAGLLVGLLTGGLAFIQHFILRFLLWRAGSIPWNYTRFLDYAADRILLRKVGGGYIFVHRLLLDYFASLDSTPMRDQASAQKQQVLPIS
jgi:serine/threonine protein kinase